LIAQPCEATHGADLCSVAGARPSGSETRAILAINISGKRSAKLIKGAKEIFYPGLPHGLTATNADQVIADLLKFVKSVQQGRKAA